jgi:hypothetical protein
MTALIHAMPFLERLKSVLCTSQAMPGALLVLENEKYIQVSGITPIAESCQICPVWTEVKSA